MGGGKQAYTVDDREMVRQQGTRRDPNSGLATVYTVPPYKMDQENLDFFGNVEDTFRVSGLLEGMEGEEKKRKELLEALERLGVMPPGTQPGF